MTAPYRVLILTCDAYLEALRITAWLLNKYWKDSPEVLIGGFTPPEYDLPPKFSFLSLGRNESYPVERYSDALIKFLQMVDDDVFVFLLDDFWFVYDVPNRGIDIAVDLARQTPNLLRIDLIGDRVHENIAFWNHAESVATIDGYTFIKSDPRTPYQYSVAPSVFRRDVLLANTYPGYTPWNLETEMTTMLHAKGEAVQVYGTTKPLMLINNGMAQDGKRYKRGLRGIDAADAIPEMMQTFDRDELTRLGILDKARLTKHARQQ